MRSRRRCQPMTTRGRRRVDRSFGRLGRLGVVAGAVVAVALIASLFALPQTEAGFAAVTDNIANTMAADTLDPPTVLTATDGGTITLGWTATADTYADGHRILRSTSPGGPYTQIAEITPRTTVTYQDTPPHTAPITMSHAPSTEPGKVPTATKTSARYRSIAPPIPISAPASVSTQMSAEPTATNQATRTLSPIQTDRRSPA